MTSTGKGLGTTTPRATKMLVTGSSGRLGRSLRSRLDSDPATKPVYLIGQHSVALSASDVRVDVSDADAVRDIIATQLPDVIIHLAAVTGAASEADPTSTDAINVGAARTITQAADDAGAERIVFASTSAVYGDKYGQPVTELHPPQPTSAYGLSKLRAEYAFAQARRAQTVSLRIFNLYGPDFENSLVWQLEHSSSEKPVDIRGLDHFIRDYVHVDDVADALAAAATAPLPSQHTVLNIGSGRAISNRELISRVGASQEIHYRVIDDQLSYSCASIKLARTQIGFEPSRFV